MREYKMSSKKKRQSRKAEAFRKARREMLISFVTSVAASILANLICRLLGV